MADGLNIHADLLAIITRAEAAGVSASEAATVRLAEAGRDRMRETLLSGSGVDGGPPRARTERLARSVRAVAKYSETGVVVHVGPTGSQEHIGRILDRGWHAHGPVRGRGRGSYHRYPFVAVVADESRADVESVGNAEVAVRVREAGF